MNEFDLKNFIYQIWVDTIRDNYEQRKRIDKEIKEFDKEFEK